MNDKLIAGLATALVIAPICAVCILGPAVLGLVLGGAFGWIAGLSPVATAGLAIVGAIFVYGYFSRRKKATAGDDPPLRKPADGPKMTELPGR